LGIIQIKPQTSGCVALRVKINQEDFLSGERDARREINGRGSFPDPTLLIGNADYLGHEVPSQVARQLKLAQDFYLNNLFPSKL